jgi:hypothetical protein
VDTGFPISSVTGTPFGLARCLRNRAFSSSRAFFFLADSISKSESVGRFLMRSTCDVGLTDGVGRCEDGLTGVVGVGNDGFGVTSSNCRSFPSNFGVDVSTGVPNSNC